jgi:hypothetical protein
MNPLLCLMLVSFSLSPLWVASLCFSSKQIISQPLNYSGMENKSHPLAISTEDRVNVLHFHIGAVNISDLAFRWGVVNDVWMSLQI